MSCAERHVAWGYTEGCEAAAVMSDEVRIALIAWLRGKGLDAVADDFEQGIVWYQEGDVLWHAEGIPGLDPEDIAPVVVSRLGRCDATAYGEAAWALGEAVHKYGPPPTDPSKVGPYFEKCVRWAEGVARKRLAVWNVPGGETYHKLGIVPRPPARQHCSWSRPRSGHSPRRRRRGPSAARARSPGRLDDDPPHELARSRKGRA